MDQQAGTETDLTASGYYYNTTTGEVEQGLVSDWTQRMGPYATRAEAEQALSTARGRTEKWDDDDRRWKDGE